MCEREAEIEGFMPRAYWAVGAEVAAGKRARFGDRGYDPVFDPN